MKNKNSYLKFKLSFANCFSGQWGRTDISLLDLLDPCGDAVYHNHAAWPFWSARKVKNSRFTATSFGKDKFTVRSHNWTCLWTEKFLPFPTFHTSEEKDIPLSSNYVSNGSRPKTSQVLFQFISMWQTVGQ